MGLVINRRSEHSNLRELSREIYKSSDSLRIEIDTRPP